MNPLMISWGLSRPRMNKIGLILLIWLKQIKKRCFLQNHLSTDAMKWWWWRNSGGARRWKTTMTWCVIRTGNLTTGLDWKTKKLSNKIGIQKLSLCNPNSKVLDQKDSSSHKMMKFLTHEISLWSLLTQIVWPMWLGSTEWTTDVSLYSVEIREGSFPTARVKVSITRMLSIKPLKRCARTWYASHGTFRWQCHAF